MTHPRCTCGPYHRPEIEQSLHFLGERNHQVALADPSVNPHRDLPMRSDVASARVSRRRTTTAAITRFREEIPNTSNGGLRCRLARTRRSIYLGFGCSGSTRDPVTVRYACGVNESLSSKLRNLVSLGASTSPTSISGHPTPSSRHSSTPYDTNGYVINPRALRPHHRHESSLGIPRDWGVFASLGSVRDAESVPW